MKKMIALTLALMLLLSLAACGKQEAETQPATEGAQVPTEAPTEAPTEEPAPTEPETEPGIARAGYGEAVYATLDRGTEITVIGQWKDYYVISGEQVDLLVEKRVIRLDSSAPFEGWTGYARAKTLVFDNVYFEGEPVATLQLNTKVDVIEAGTGWVMIQWEEGAGYVDADSISRWPVKAGGGSGNSGSSNSGAGAPAQESGDINLDLLAYFGPGKQDLEETGTILADDVRGILCITLRDDEVKVLSVGEEECQLYLEGFTAVVPRWLLRLEGDEEYEAWTGYARAKAIVYEEYQMRNEWMKLNLNTKVTVLDELPDCYVVEIEGQIGYMELTGVSTHKQTYSSGGSGGSSAPSGGSNSTWTPPAL